VGGGFAGLHLIRHLDRLVDRTEVELTLIDRNNYHLFTPLLYQVATGELPPHAVAYPLRMPIARARWQFARTEVAAIDLDGHLVRTADGEFPYDHLVLVPGSVTNDYGIPGVWEHAVGMKWLGDAQQLRRRIIGAFERAALEGDPARRGELLRFVIVGAGPVGVELASSLRDLMDHTLRQLFPSVDLRRHAEIVLIDGADRVLSQMDERLSRLAARRLERQRVRVVLRTLVSEIGDGEVRAKDGSMFRGATIVWAGGVRTNPIVSGLEGVPHAKDGRLVVDECFRAGGRDDLITFGDAAFFPHDGRPLPQLAQVAVVQAPQAARNVAHLVRGEPLEPYRHRERGDLIALGRTNAGARIGGAVFGGFPAWSVWRIYYLMQLLGVRNRATLLVEWLLSYFVTRMVADTP